MKEEIAHREPSEELKPEKVVELQVEALGENDTPQEDAGIETAYSFASPANKRSTGPLPRFKEMVHNDIYGDMLDHDAAEYRQIQRNETEAMQVVELEKNGVHAVYEFRLSIQESGEHAGCWMTDSVRRMD